MPGHHGGGGPGFNPGFGGGLPVGGPGAGGRQIYVANVCPFPFSPRPLVLPLI